MFQTFRVAGLAAAVALLCASPAAAAAEAAQASPATHAAAAAPAAPVSPASLVNVEPAVLTATPAEVSARTDADDALSTGRVRPDRVPPLLEAPRSEASEAVISQSGRTQPSRPLPLAELVAQHAGAETTDEQFECLASAVYFEARGEPLEGQLAVAEVILNRVASGRFRSTICDVVKQPSQFSFVRRGVIPAAPRGSAAWQRAVAIAHIALQDLADITGDSSLFFHATYVRPAWGRASARIARIGNHIFYR